MLQKVLADSNNMIYSDAPYAFANYGSLSPTSIS